MLSSRLKTTPSFSTQGLLLPSHDAPALLPQTLRLRETLRAEGWAHNVVMSPLTCQEAWGNTLLTQGMEGGAQAALLLPHSPLVCKLLPGPALLHS